MRDHARGLLHEQQVGCHVPSRGGYNSDGITNVGVGGGGWGGGVLSQAGGSDDGMTITIAPLSLYRNCKPFWQNVSRNDWTVWTVFMGYTNPCATYCLVFSVARLAQ